MFNGNRDESEYSVNSSNNNKKTIKNFTPINNEVKRVFFADNSGLGHGEFALFIYIAMHVQHSPDAGKGSPNGKQGYAYPTKRRISTDLDISRPTLDKYLKDLVNNGLIEYRNVRNSFGGHPLYEYKIADKYKL